MASSSLGLMNTSSLLVDGSMSSHDFQDRTSEFRSYVAEYCVEAVQNQTKGVNQNGYDPSSSMGNLESGLGPIGGDPEHPIKQRSKFNQAARKINTSLTIVMERLEKLGNLARQRSLFNDPIAEVNKLTYMVTHDLKSINADIDALEKYVIATSENGETGSVSGSAQSKKNSNEIMKSLKSKLRTTSKTFTDVLRMRSSNLQEQSSRRSEYGAEWKNGGEGVGANVIGGSAGMGGGQPGAEKTGGGGGGGGAVASIGAKASAQAQAKRRLQEYGQLRQRLQNQGGVGDDDDDDDDTSGTNAWRGGPAAVGGSGPVMNQSGVYGGPEPETDLEDYNQRGPLLARPQGQGQGPLVGVGHRGGLGGSVGGVSTPGPGGNMSSNTWVQSAPVLPSFDSLLDGESEDQKLNAQHQQQDQSQLLVPVNTQDDFFQSRAMAVENLQSTIEEIATMYRRLNELVLMQEEMTVRIDANVEETLVNVDQGHNELLKYMDGLSSNTWLILKIFGILIIFALFFVSFVA